MSRIDLILNGDSDKDKKKEPEVEKVEQKENPEISDYTDEDTHYTGVDVSAGRLSDVGSVFSVDSDTGVLRAVDERNYEEIQRVIRNQLVMDRKIDVLRELMEHMISRINILDTYRHIERESLATRPLIHEPNNEGE